MQEPGLPGQLIDVNGRRLYIHHSGSGPGPTVLLESGSTMPSILWAPVQRQVASFARVVSYDRAGYGFNDPAGRDRSGEQVVAELHALLEQARIPGPYILVGHSLGGLYVRLFAAHYPDQVVGILLVDAMQEEWRRQMGAGHRRVDALSRRFLVLLSLLGEPRRSMQRNPGLLTGNDGPWIEQFTSAEQALFWRALYTPRLTLAALREWVQVDRLEEAVRQAGTLGDLPLVVLSRTRPQLDGWGYSAEAKARIWALEQEAQEALARLSTRAEHVQVPESGHLLYVERPEAVVAAIRSLLARL